MAKTLTIQLCHIQKYTGPDTEVNSPEGVMPCVAGNYVVTDENVGKWVFTEEQLKALKEQRPPKQRPGKLTPPSQN